MRGRKRFNESDEVTDINISPLIDMVFILLIFFIVTTVFVEEKGFEANTPDPAPPNDDEEKDEKLILSIKKNGSVYAKQGASEREIGRGGVLARVRQEMQRKAYPMLIELHPDTIVDLYVSVHDQCITAGAEGVTMKIIDDD